MVSEPLLSRFHDQPSRRSLLLEYTGRMTEKCVQLRQGLETGDVELVQRIGHQYKGSGAGFGYPAITEAGAHLEQAAKHAGTINPSVCEAGEALIALCRRAQLGMEQRDNQ